MSKKKMFNLIESITAGLLLLSWFILPYGALVIDPTEHPFYLEKLRVGNYTFFQFITDFFSYSRIALLIIVAVILLICLISLFGKSEKKDSVAHVVLPIIALVFGFFLFSNFIGEPSFGYDFILASSSQIVSYVLLALITVFAFLKRSQFAFPKNDTPVVVEKKSVPVSTTDELKKYKELLDSGVITQEEFDAKKKQLMGL